MAEPTFEQELAYIKDAIDAEAGALAQRIKQLIIRQAPTHAMALAALIALAEAAGMVLGYLEANDVPGGVAVAERHFRKRVTEALVRYRARYGEENG